MNKKIKMFVSLLMLVFSGFVIYSIINKKLLVKADQPSARLEAKLDANVYRGGR